MFLLRITAGVLIAASVLLCSVRSDDLIETQAGFSNNDDQQEQQYQNQHQDQDQDLAGDRNPVPNNSGELDQTLGIVYRKFAAMKQELNEKDAKNHELSSRLREAEVKIASLEANSHGEGVIVTVPKFENIRKTWIETNYGKVEPGSDGKSFVEATKRTNRTLSHERETFKRAFNYLLVRLISGDDREQQSFELPRDRLEIVEELAVRINQYDQWIASKYRETVDNIVAMEAQHCPHCNGGDAGERFVEAAKKARDDFFRYRANIVEEFNDIIARIQGSGLEGNRMMYSRNIHIFTKVLGELALEDFAEAKRNAVHLQAFWRAKQTSS